MLSRPGLGLGMVAAVCAILFALTPFGHALEEDLGLGWLFRMRGPRQPPRDVVVVAIDGESARALGQLPQPAQWPRTLHARLIDALSTAGVRVIGFDLSFAVPARDPNDDRALATAVARAGNVVLLDFLEQPDTGRVELQIEQRLPPIELLADSAAAHGPFPLPKTGLVHAYWLARSGAGGVATLPVLAWQIFDAEAARATLSKRGSGAEDEARYLDYYGPPRSVRTVGFHDVLEAAARGSEGAAWLRETFAGRAAFVGFSAAHPSGQDRIRDDYRTVFSRSDGFDLSGVEIAATAFANLVENRAPTPLPNALQMGLLLAWGLLLGALGTALRGGYAVAAVAAASAGYLALAHIRFGAAAQWLPLVGPLLVQAPLALFGGLLWQYIEGQREGRRLGALLHDLLPPAVVDNLLGRLRQVAPAERDLFGVFVYTDVEGFTLITEGMAPTEATRLLNDYFALIFPPVEERGGSVSDIVGDGMLAFWVTAGPEAEGRRAACLAALDIANLTSHADMLPGWPRLPTRIGVHGGPLMLARVGASRHHEYRLVGDAVNTASRIEALSKHLGTKLLISEDVLARLDDLLTRPVGAFLLAGKSTPVRIAELLARTDDASAEQRWLCTAFADAIEAYRARRWDEAAARWADILQRFPNDGPSHFYLLRTRQHAADPPPADWDAVERMTSK
jgi:adenylate cyclase